MHKEILVIDDNPDIRFLICNILKEQNFEVRSAANYDQALLEINKRLNLEENFDQEIEDLNQETENLVSEIEKWQM